MPIARFQMPDGRVARFEVPEGTSPEQAQSMMAAHFSQAQPSPAQPQPAQQAAQPEGSTIGNLLGGAASGAGQIGSTLLAPVDWALKKAGLENENFDRRKEIEAGLRNMGVNPESGAFKIGEIGAEIAGTGGIGGALGKGAAKFGAERLGQAIASGGFDVGKPAASLGGKSVNAALRVGGGAATGSAAGGLINPDDVGAGALAGGAFGSLSPVIGKAVSPIAKALIARPAEDVMFAVDKAVAKVAQDAGIPISELPAEQVQFVRQEVAKAFAKGKELDAAALLRKRDFEQLGINPLQSQITRNPNQFAQERNLRGVSPEIAARLQEQNQALQKIFGKHAATAQEATPAGRSFIEVLQKQDDAAKAQVNALYQAAKAEGGRYAGVDHIQFVNQANDALDKEMLGRFLPEQARGLLNDVAAGKVPLNVNNLVQVDSVLSAAQRSADDAGAKAIGVVRDALHNAPIESGAGEAAKAAFDTARKAARERFAQQEANPALKAVVEGKINADDFVRKYVVQGKTDEVNRLADMLRQSSPENFNQAKAQIADDIRNAAFGENAAGDSPIRPDMLAKKLRKIGTEKMQAFFSPEEIDNYKLAMRVANYIEKIPSSSPVNTSNTLVAQLMTGPIGGAMKGAANIKGLGLAVDAANAAGGAVKNQKAIRQAINAEVPIEKLDLTEAQRKLVAKIMGGAAGATSGILSQ